MPIHDLHMKLQTTVLMYFIYKKECIFVSDSKVFIIQSKERGSGSCIRSH